MSRPNLVWYLFVLKFPLVWRSEGIKPPFSWWQVALFKWVGVFRIKVDDNMSLRILTQRVLTHSIPPIVFQLWLSFVSTHGGCSVHYPRASRGWRHLHPLPNTCNPVDIHFYYTLPEVFTHHMWMLQWTSTEEVVTSHWSTHGKSCWPGTGWSPDHYLLMAYSCYHSPWELA